MHKTYIGFRHGRTTIDRVEVFVVTQETLDDVGREYPLHHHLRHSPDGFNWGYGGSGPAELARSILIDFLGTDRVSGSLYQEFKAQLIARINQETTHWRMPHTMIEVFLALPEIQAIDRWLDDADFPPTMDDDDRFDPEAWFADQEAQNRALKDRYNMVRAIP